MAKQPPYENKICYGIDLRNETTGQEINLAYLINMYAAYPDKKNFFNNYFEKLAGTGALRKQIENGWSAAKIRETWQPGLAHYKQLRKQYLLYP